MRLSDLELKLPGSERQLWRLYLTDHMGKNPPGYDPRIRIKFTSIKTTYKVLVNGVLVAYADYSTSPPKLSKP